MAHMPLPLSAVLDIGPEVLQLLDEVLGLAGRGETFPAGQGLMGELVAAGSEQAARVVAAVEQRFCIRVTEADLDAGCLATVGSLVDLVIGRLT